MSILVVQIMLFRQRIRIRTARLLYELAHAPSESHLPKDLPLHLSKQ